MENIYMFQAIFGKVDEFGWWVMKIIQTESGMHFTSKEFHESLSLLLALAAPDYQEINVQIEVTWQTF